MVAALVAIGFKTHLKLRNGAKHRAQSLFAGVMPLFDSGTMAEATTAGVWQFEGVYKGNVIQLKVIADLLATRKLPSLWLMATRPTPMPVAGTFDLMMRPAGLTSFSNFDFLTHAWPAPPDFPRDAVLRSDTQHLPVPPELVRPFLPRFGDLQGKELLITPKGVRLVVLVAEADKARYGVLRQADFGDHRVEPEPLTALCEMLISLETSVKEHARVVMNG